MTHLRPMNPALAKQRAKLRAQMRQARRGLQLKAIDDEASRPVEMVKKSVLVAASVEIGRELVFNLRDYLPTPPEIIPLVIDDGDSPPGDDLLPPAAD